MIVDYDLRGGEIVRVTVRSGGTTEVFGIEDLNDLLPMLELADDIVTWKRPINKLLKLWDSEMYDDEELRSKYLDLHAIIFKETGDSPVLNKTARETLGGSLPKRDGTMQADHDRSLQRVMIIESLSAFVEASGYLLYRIKDEQKRVEIDLDVIRAQKRDV